MAWLQGLLGRLQAHCVLRLHHLLSLSAAGDQAQAPVHLDEAHSASLVLPLQNLAHFPDASLYGAEEGLFKVFSQSHRLKNDLKFLQGQALCLNNVQDAVGEGLHGDLKVFCLDALVGRTVNDFSDAAVLVRLNPEHIQFNHVHDFHELC